MSASGVSPAVAVAALLTASVVVGSKAQAAPSPVGISSSCPWDSRSVLGRADEFLEPELQAEQIRLFREAWTAAGHEREPRVSVSRSIFALVDDRDRVYFGRGNQESDQVGYIDPQTRAIFGRSYAAEPDVLVKELAGDTAIQAADTLLLTVPNQLGVEYNAHAIESILRYVAPELGWR